MPPQIATHTSHLATLSTLLLSFLPEHLQPHLPAPSAPHGYPKSNTPSSAIARRQMFDYPPSRHPGQGSTSRLSGALGMVREHYDLTRGGAAGGVAGAGGPGAAGARGYGQAGGRKRTAQVDYSIYGDDYPMAGGAAAAAAAHGRKDKDKDPAQRHPNQYTKKRLQGAASGGAGMGGVQGGYGGVSPSGALGGVISAQSANAAAGVYSNAVPHPMGMTAVEAVKEKRRGQEAATGASSAASAAAAAAAGMGSTSGPVSRSSSVAPGAGGAAMGYQGMASQSEYDLATLGGSQQRGPAKRKVEDVAGASKRRKKGCVPLSLDLCCLPARLRTSRAPSRRPVADPPLSLPQRQRLARACRPLAPRHRPSRRARASAPELDLDPGRRAAVARRRAAARARRRL